MRGSHSLTIAALCILSAGPALAQGNCAPRDTLGQALVQSYGEGPVLMGITTTGAILEFWANPETGSWTVITIMPDGTACIRAAGDNFEAMPVGAPA